MAHLPNNGKEMQLYVVVSVKVKRKKMNVVRSQEMEGGQTV